MKSRMPQNSIEQRGAALLLVVWVVALLSLLAATALALTVNAAKIARSMQARLALESAADAAISRTLLGLADPDPTRHPPINGTWSAIQSFGFSVDVKIVDDGGKLDVNTAPQDWLVGLFVATGAASNEADHWVRRLRGESGDQIRPTLRRLDDVASIAGIPPTAFQCVRPYITVYTQFPNVDWRQAAPVLRKAIIALQVGDAAVIMPPAGAAATLESYAGRVFEVVATARDSQNALSFSRTVIARITGDSELPFLIEDWQESEHVESNAAPCVGLI